MMTADSIAAAARELIGMRWVHMGRAGLDGRDGVDCAGVIAWVLHRHGVHYEEPVGSYSPFPDGVSLKMWLDRVLIPSPVDEIVAGRVIVVWSDGHPVGFEPPQHLLLVTGVDPVTVLHGTNATSLRRVVEHRIPPKWLRRVVLAYRLPGGGP